MQNKPGFWEIYKKNAFSHSRATPFILILGLWYSFIFIWSDIDTVLLPKVLVMAIPFLLAELAYIYTCIRKYKAAAS